MVCACLRRRSTGSLRFSLETGRMSARAGAFRAEGPGLVHSSTSENGRFHADDLKAEGLKTRGLLVDRVLTRLKKMRYGTLTAARLQGEQLVRHGHRYKAAMVTLTYGPDSEHRSRHLSEYLDRTRKFAKAAGQKLRYCWVGEMQQRGVLHYHIIFWLPYVMGKPFRLPKPDESGHWPHGMSEIKWARKAAGYLAKYTSKGQDVGDPPFPRGVRICGVGGLDAEGRREYRWWRAPSEAREVLGQGADLRRLKGGRFDAVTGLFWESRWTFLLINGTPYIVPKGEASCLA